LYNCTIISQLYQKPYPIIRLELYGFDGYNAGANVPGPPFQPPIVNDSGTIREVLMCDHISVRGLYVIDHGHPMYYPEYTESYCYNIIYSSNFAQRACKPHAELHPYQWHSVDLVKPLQWPTPAFTPNVETHTVAVPFYKEVYGQSRCFNILYPYCWKWHCVYPSEGGSCNQVIDHTKQNESLNVEWYIEAPPRPSGTECGSLGVCKITYQEDVLWKTGQVSVNIIEESNRIRVQVDAIAPIGSDYVISGGSSYKLMSPSQYIARYSVWWVPDTGSPDQEQQQSK
jgi:hypothetical protein